MKLMKEQPVLTVGVASGAMAILLLALGSIQGPADDASPRSVRRPGPTTVVIEGALRPGMEIYATPQNPKTPAQYIIRLYIIKYT